MPGRRACSCLVSTRDILGTSEATGCVCASPAGRGCREDEAGAAAPRKEGTFTQRKTIKTEKMGGGGEEGLNQKEKVLDREEQRRADRGGGQDRETGAECEGAERDQRKNYNSGHEAGDGQPVTFGSLTLLQEFSASAQGQDPGGSLSVGAFLFHFPTGTLEVAASLPILSAAREPRGWASWLSGL